VRVAKGCYQDVLEWAGMGIYTFLLFLLALFGVFEEAGAGTARVGRHIGHPCAPPARALPARRPADWGSEGTTHDSP
jgi:hypothetical protein